MFLGRAALPEMQEGWSIDPSNLASLSADLSSYHGSSTYS